MKIGISPWKNQIAISAGRILNLGTTDRSLDFLQGEIPLRVSIEIDSTFYWYNFNLKPDRLKSVQKKRKGRSVCWVIVNICIGIILIMCISALPSRLIYQFDTDLLL